MTYSLTARSNRSPLSLFDKFFGEFYTDRTAIDGAHTPPINITESDESLSLEFELPGVADSDIDIEIVGNRLTLQAKRELGETDNVRVHAFEHRFGTISRRVMLPRGLDTENVAATLSNGVLTLTLPKTEPAKPRKVEIRTK